MQNELREIALADKELFNKTFAQVKEPLADTTFTMRRIWAGPLRHTWTVINGNLCVFGYDKGRYVVWGPPVGGEKLAETIVECFKIVDELNKSAGATAKPAVIYLPQCLKAEYDEVAGKTGASLGYWTQDYVYETRSLIELKGKEFDSKRNKASFFMKNYNHRIEEFDSSSHLSDCLQLTELWNSGKTEVNDGSYGHELESETETARTLLKLSEALDVRGIVLKVDGRVVGYSIGELLRDGVVSNIVEKTHPAIKGAAQFIFREFARFWAGLGCEFLNAQDDFGVEYLKRVKLSYHPARLVVSYCLEKK